MAPNDTDHTKWEALMAEGLQSFKRAKHEEARKHYDAAVRLAEGFGPEDVRLGLALYRLGWMRYLLRPGRANATELPRALAILEKTLPPEDPDLISCLRMLVAQRNYGDPAGREEAQQRLLEILEQVHGPAHEEVTQLVNDLGYNLVAQKKFAEAEQLYTRWLGAAEKAWGSEDPRAIRMLERLGKTYLAQGKGQQAELLFMRAFQGRIRSNVPMEEQLGLPVDDDLSNVVLKFLDQFEPQDLRLARGLLFLGSGTRHKPHVRDPILLRGLSLLDDQFSPKIPESIECLRMLNRIDRNQLFNAEVQTKLMRFLARKDLPVEAALNLIDSLGYALRCNHKHADEERLYRQWLERTEKAWGPDDPRVTKVASALAYHYFHQKSYSRAETLYQRLFATVERLHGPESEHASSMLYYLGLIARDQHRYPEAETYLRRAIEIDKGDQNALSNLAYVLGQSGRFEEAAEFQARADEISARFDD